MHGFEQSLEADLKHLIGAEIAQVSVGKSDIIFRLHPQNEFTVEGSWKIFSEDGSLVDSYDAGDGEDRHFTELFKLISATIESFTVVDASTLRIGFTCGFSLEIYDNEMYETCFFSPDIYI